MKEKVRVCEVEFEQCREQIQALRFEVFVDEQKVPAELEMDEWDELSRHVLAFSGETVVGTGRLLPDGHIGRVAVRKHWRGRGVGLALMEEMIAMGKSANLGELALSAQTQALAFYERLGFIAHGGVYEEAGIEHIKMRMKV